MTSKSTKSKGADSKDACVHLETMNKVSYSLQPLCYCKERDLVIGKNALVCLICDLFKKSDNQIGEMYVTDALDGEYGVWDDEDFYEVIEDEEDEEEEEDEDDDMPQKRRTRKITVLDDEDEEDDEEEKKKKEAEEEKIPEELFGLTEKKDEEPEIEDLEKEIHEVYDRKERKLAKAREKGIEVDTDEDLDLIDDLDDDDVELEIKTSKSKKGKASAVEDDEDVPDIKIEITKDGKQRCPYCKKEFASVARHVTRCKYSPGPEGVAAVKKATEKLNK